MESSLVCIWKSTHPITVLTIHLVSLAYRQADPYSPHYGQDFRSSLLQAYLQYAQVRDLHMDSNYGYKLLGNRFVFRE